MEVQVCFKNQNDSIEAKSIEIHMYHPTQTIVFVQQTELENTQPFIQIY